MWTIQDFRYIFSVESLTETGYWLGEQIYIMSDFICMGLLELRRTQSKQELQN